MDWCLTRPYAQVDAGGRLQIDVGDQEVIMAMSVGEQIRRARERQGMSIDELAVDVRRATGMRRGVSREAMRRIEDGAAKPDHISPVILAAICRLLDLDLEVVSPKHHADIQRLWQFLSANPPASANGDDSMALRRKESPESQRATRRARPVPGVDTPRTAA